MGHINSPFCLQEKKGFGIYTDRPKEKISYLNEEEEVSGTGNALLPSAHLSIQMSTHLREHPHVNMKSSGQ